VIDEERKPELGPGGPEASVPSAEAAMQTTEGSVEAAASLGSEGGTEAVADDPGAACGAPAAAVGEQGLLLPAQDSSVPLDPRSAAVRIAEALLFASDTPLGARQLATALPGDVEPEAVIATLRSVYAGRGVELVEVAGGWMFRTAADLAPVLRRRVVVPKRLSRAALETLATIAYHQPVTRAEVEEVRGVALAQGVLDALLEAGLIEPRGRRESPGRPALWATTEAFLRQFGLARIEDLPRAQDLPGVSLPLEPPAGAIGSAAQAEPAGSGGAAVEHPGEGQDDPVQGDGVTAESRIGEAGAVAEAAACQHGPVAEASDAEAEPGRPAQS